MDIQFEHPLSLFWFRRDLRIEDNAGLSHTLQSGRPVLPLFIFDLNILESLAHPEDRRVEFIHQTLQELQQQLISVGSSLWVEIGRPPEIMEKLITQLPIAVVYTNHDYEPYARQRDEQVEPLLKARGIPFKTFKDQVIFEKDEILTASGTPYTVFTPYRNRWRDQLTELQLTPFPSLAHQKNFLKMPPRELPSLESLGFRPVGKPFPPKQIPERIIRNYHRTRDYPGMEGTTRLGVHLRFGTISIRRLVQRTRELNEVFLDELNWREFFMMSIWHFPHIVEQPFQDKYKVFYWRQNESDFQRWCEGRTGFPMVDAGMRQLNATGFMHNRVRMITANFLTKLLLIDWRWGEAYFAEKLLDYEQASNVGNWQWSAGCGMDAAPYFRIFNPDHQLKKFDPELRYVKQWIPEYGSRDYPSPMIDYRMARERALQRFKTL